MVQIKWPFSIWKTLNLHYRLNILHGVHSKTRRQTSILNFQVAFWAHTKIKISILDFTFTMFFGLLSRIIESKSRYKKSSNMIEFMTNTLVVRTKMTNSLKVIIDKSLKTIVIWDMMWHNDVSMWHISFINHKIHM